MAWLLDHQANFEAVIGANDDMAMGTMQELQARTRTLEGVAGFTPRYGQGDIRFSGSGEPERVTAVPVTVAAV
jgi:hypothetical protein